MIIDCKWSLKRPKQPDLSNSSVMEGYLTVHLFAFGISTFKTTFDPPRVNFGHPWNIRSVEKVFLEKAPDSIKVNNK